MKDNTCRLLTIFVVIWILSLFLPILNIEVKCGLLLIISLLGLIINPDIKKENHVILLILFIAVQFVWAMFGCGIPNYHALIYSSLVYVASVITCGCLKYLTLKQIKFLSGFIILIFLITNLSTFTALLINPNLVREYAYQDIIERNNYENLSSYNFIFPYDVGEGMAIMLPAILCFGVFSKNRLLLITSVVTAFVGVATQIMGTLFTSAILSLVFCVLIFLFFLKRTKGGTARNFLLITLITVVAIAIIPKVSILDNNGFMTKFGDVQSSVIAGNSVGRVETRTSLYTQSLNVFFHNPILGLGKIPESFGSYNEDTVSMHTAILDYLGMYGLLALLFFISWKKTISESLCELNKDRQKQYRLYVYSLFFLLLFKGPVSIHINFFFSTVLVGVLIRRELLYNDNVQSSEI